MTPEDFIECFAPFSKLFNFTTIPEKIKKLDSYFGKIDYINLKLNIYRGRINKDIKITIPDEEFQIACGIYLDCSFVHGVIYTPTEKLSTKYMLAFHKMSNVKKKILKEIENRNYSTREFFDIGSTEEKLSTFEQKREQIKKILETDEIQPSILFYHHLHSYRKINRDNNYTPVIKEAPYSSFSLCFSNESFIVPNIKEYYSQSLNKDKLIEIDFKKYKILD